MFQTLKLSVSLGFLAFISTYLFACLDDVPEPEFCTSIDPVVLSSKLTPTSPFTLIEDPFTKEADIVYDPAIVSIQGQTTLFDFLNIGGKYNEAAFGVLDAPSYYSFDLDTMKEDDSFFLFVNIEDDTPVGCFSVFTYESASVSDGIVSQFAIDLLPRGGSNVDRFAGKSWRLHYTLDPNNNTKVYTDSLYQEMLLTSGLCAEDIQTEYRYRTNEYLLDLEFNADFSLSKEYYSRSLDFNSSSCSDLVYEESIDNFRFVGSWSYNDSESTLTIVYLYGLEDPYFPGMEYAVYEVSYSEDQLVLALMNYAGVFVPVNERIQEFFIEI